MGQVRNKTKTARRRKGKGMPIDIRQEKKTVAKSRGVHEAPPPAHKSTSA